MARYTGPRHKACRRARTPLCQSKRCPVDRRPYPPGQHGRGRIRESDYLVQLREKQKLRTMYGVLERQFRLYYKEAARRPGITGDNLLVNGKKVDIPSYQVRPGDVVTIKDKSRDAIVIQHAVDTQGREAPAWLSVDLGERKVDVTDHPRRDQIDTAINEQLIVELYSK